MLQSITNTIAQFWTCLKQTTIIQTTINDTEINISIAGLLIGMFSISVAITFIHILIVGSHSEGDKS